MRPPVPSALTRLVIVALVATLAAGSGLSGLVKALGASGHVCMCMSGGSHAACPVCNPHLASADRATGPSVDGLPCGDKRVTLDVASEPALVPAGAVVLAVPYVRGAAPGFESGIPPRLWREPPTPPPRSARL